MTRMMRVGFAGLMSCAIAGAVTCATGLTHIVDHLVAIDGSDARGSISVYGPSAPIGMVVTVVQSRVTVPIAAGGVVDFCLAGAPAYAYDATYALVDAQGRPTTGWIER